MDAQLRTQMMNMKISTECCAKMCYHLMKNVLPASRIGIYLEDGSIRFTEPNARPRTCFRLQMGDDFELSIAISPDRMFNRAEHGEIFLNSGTQFNGNPKTVEIFIVNEPSHLEEALGYDGDIQSFKRDEFTLEEGFSCLVDEILHIRRIVYGLPDENGTLDEAEGNLTDAEEEEFPLQQEIFNF